MIFDQIESFVEALIQKTKDKQLEWEVFNTDDDVIRMIPEIELATGVDLGVNTLAYWKSYFSRKKDGYVFLTYIFHGDPSTTSLEMDSLILLVKINREMKIINLTSYIDGEEHQQRLNTLKMLIDSIFEEKEHMPDVLYNFMHDFLQ